METRSQGRSRAAGRLDARFGVATFVYCMAPPDPTADVITTKDPQYIDRWEEYWMAMAFAAARKSKDPRCRVGAVIVRENIVLSTGFNGFARQVFDNPELLGDADEKLRLICHAEQNAILNAARLGVALEGATIYVTKFPCLACCNAIIQSGIREIYTHDTKFWDDDPADGDHSRKKSALRQAHITIHAPFHPEYLPQRVTESAPAMRPNSVTGGSAVPQLSAVPVPSPKKTKGKGKKAKGAQAEKTMSLFPARKPIRGGKAE